MWEHGSIGSNCVMIFDEITQWPFFSCLVMSRIFRATHSSGAELVVVGGGPVRYLPHHQHCSYDHLMLSNMKRNQWKGEEASW